MGLSIKGKPKSKKAVIYIPKTLKKYIDERFDIIYERINTLYSDLNGDIENDENVMDKIFLLQDELNSLKEIKSICETRGRY